MTTGDGEKIQKFMQWSEPPYIEDWTWIMEVVDRIENIQLHEKFYKWEYQGKMNYNFNEILFEIGKYETVIYFDWNLDPMTEEFSHYGLRKEENTILCILKFLETHCGIR